MPQYLPWVECNDNEAASVAVVTDGVVPWKNVISRMIVTTAPGEAAALYATLASLPVSIIGGFKTSGLASFADVAGWATLAGIAETIAGLTGNSSIILECETALENFHNGLENIDYSLMEAALASLRATGLDFHWWYPALLANSAGVPDRLSRTTQLVGACATALPNSYFITGYTGTYDWESTSETTLRTAMRALIGASRVFDMLYVRDDGLLEGSGIRVLTTAEALAYEYPAPNVRRLHYRGRSSLVTAPIVYPGQAQFVGIGEEFEAALG